MGGVFSSMKKGNTTVEDYDESIILPSNFSPPEYSENERVAFVPKSERVDYDNDKKYKFRVFMDFEDLSRLDKYEVLPEISLRQILYYVTPPDLFNISLACRYFEKSTMSNFFWKNYFYHFFEVSDEREDIPDPKCNFKKHFYEHYVIYESERKKRERTFRVVILGDSHEEHSVFSQYFLNARDAFKTFCTKDLLIQDGFDGSIPVTAEVWKIDKFVQERDLSFTRSLIKGADACLFTSDSTYSSFRKIRSWRKIFRSHKNFTIEEEREFPISVVVENRDRLGSDYYYSRSEEYREYCEENGFGYHEIELLENEYFGDDVISDLFELGESPYRFERNFYGAEREVNKVLRCLLRRCILLRTKKESDVHEEE